MSAVVAVKYEYSYASVYQTGVRLSSLSEVAYWQADNPPDEDGLLAKLATVVTAVVVIGDIG